MSLDRIMHLRDAIREELDATNTYDSLIPLFPEYREQLEEIKADEINHFGRLTEILLRLDPGADAHFEAGLRLEDG